jgi:cytochrome c551/c552
MRYLSLLALVALAVLVGCAPTTAKLSYADVPTNGDAAHGKQIFHTKTNGGPACAECHSLEVQTVIGPGLAGLADRAGKRVEGKSAREYVFESITRPAIYIVSGFSNLMYTQYSDTLSKQDIADLLAFLLGPQGNTP